VIGTDVVYFASHLYIQKIFIFYDTIMRLFNAFVKWSSVYGAKCCRFSYFLYWHWEQT